jgi:hypothetical protein
MTAPGNISIPADFLYLEFAAGAVLTALLCGLLLTAWLYLQHAAHTGSWPAVKGIVLENTVTVERGPDGQIFLPTVRYRYEVAGRSFESSSIRWTPIQHRQYTRARKLLDRYTPGQSVSVHYDPQRPYLAVLKPSRGISLPPVLVIAPTAAIYVWFIASPLLVGR